MDSTTLDSWLRRYGDALVAVGTAAVGLWMLFRGHVLTAVSLVAIGSFGVARLSFDSVRRWTDDHRYAFLVVLLVLLVLGVGGVFPTAGLD
ncbi:hypothetical protein SAMN04487949_0495 [Halogranum gelatinilyticum]|uniref:Uncharacterized protein n=1 Tax=Halogranum gelatinilyticum TaxID=660521 RepID=A0A1G9PR77_9EURY|nr:hypothetical protein [Halogranum gelatinilyticum]SDM01270.1 hypothetical protein SAMN04487949_0495 [Halogranum gelatinilyticum]